MKIFTKLGVAKIVLLLTLITTKNIAQPKPLGDSLWTLVFSDEFNGTSVDGNKWISTFPWNQATSSRFTVYNWNTFTTDTISNDNYLAYRT
jgi:hypothetical protein